MKTRWDGIAVVALGFGLWALGFVAQLVQLGPAMGHYEVKCG